MRLNMGYELEIGYNHEDFDESIFEAKKFDVGYDGSIHTRNPDAEAVELRSKVYRNLEEKDLKKIFDDFEHISPALIESNSSMGLHIHISLPKKEGKKIFKLFNYHFVEDFQRQYKMKFKLRRERGRARNFYCKFYSSEKQFVKNMGSAMRRDKNDSRYFSVNFNSYRQLGTVEFRIFPSTLTMRNFKRYVVFVHRCVSRWMDESDSKISKIPA